MSLLLIKQIELVNWQGYYGGPHKFNFEGRDGRNSSIVYADNGLGKQHYGSPLNSFYSTQLRKRMGTLKRLLLKNQQINHL